MQKAKHKGQAKDTVMVTCPDCLGKTQLQIPEEYCLAFFDCSNCKKRIGLPKDREDCCVICAYSNTMCPANPGY